MRKIRSKILIATVILILIVSFVLWDAGLQLFVKVNHASLEKFSTDALNVLDNSESDYESLQYGIWRVSCWKEAGMIEFHTQSSTAFGGTEKGFYYSSSGEPIAFNATNMPFVESGDGWRWDDPYGNWGYTEEIAAHWFWFEAHF